MNVLEISLQHKQTTFGVTTSFSDCTHLTFFHGGSASGATIRQKNEGFRGSLVGNEEEEEEEGKGLLYMTSA